MSFPLVSVFILNWNRLSETIRAIKSAQDQTYSNIEIIVVDNGSTEENTISTLSQIKEIKLITLDKNYGCPGGRNKGIPYCTGDFIFFCDNDGVLHEKAVENAVNIITSDPKIAIITGKVLDFTDASEIDTKLPILSKPYREIGLFQGGISLHRKEIYEEISYYPDDYMYGGEETFLSLKVLNANLKILKSEDVILWHKRSPIARNINKDTVSQWRNTFMNAYQLFPFEYFIVFSIYYLTVYPYYSIKHKVLGEFLKSLRSIPSDIKNYKRNPIKNSTYKIFLKLDKI